MAIPVLPAVLLICWARRGGLILPFVAIFGLGGLASFLIALGISRLMVPAQEFLAGAADSVQAGLANAFLGAALSEELGRIVASVGSITVFRYWVGRQVILACGMVGLGFAMFENLLYSLTAATGVEILIGRGLPTLSHGAVGLIMGSFLERANSTKPRLQIQPLLLAFTVPLLLHGCYDFGAFLFEVTEFPDVPDNPSITDLKPLGPVLITILLVFSVGMIELIWGARIVLGLRKAPGS